MPITFDDAYNATDPSLSEEQRNDSARAIQNGVLANEVYWNSRSELEALKAQASGHGVVQRADDEESPTQVGGATDAAVIDGTATDEPTTALGTGGNVTPAAEPAAPVPAPDNPQEAIAKLRAQIVAAGGSPEA